VVDEQEVVILHNMHEADDAIRKMVWCEITRDLLHHSRNAHAARAWHVAQILFYASGSAQKYGRSQHKLLGLIY
jgi:hypothetical protein